MIYESIINISAGKHLKQIAEITDVGSICCLDVHSDPDHNRSVITLGSNDLDEVVNAAKAITKKSFTLLDIDQHSGVHPRLGSVDVVPFVSYDNQRTLPTDETVNTSIQFGEWINTNFDTAVFYYDFANPEFISLPYIRKNAFKTLEPNIKSKFPSRHGAVCIGAREPLIAINVNIGISDLDFAKSIASEIRESSGGIVGVRAIGLRLASQNCVQVSMNIVDATNVNSGEVCLKIRDLARDYDSSVELIGLVPRFHYENWDKEFLQWSKLSPDIVIEERLNIW